ncbi:MAG TPA: hypothetical protein PKE06_08775 [Flavilitoribacter sp.]|nr:hypothetical protein [Flavilitoribacter sp.]HMQ89813.1 hypothetical protein [Flavilitoribacter sp.]
MNPRTLLTIAAALLFFGVFQACTSPQELVESGNYDQAIEMAVRKLAGKKNKKVKYVQALEDAFAKITDQDMRLADRLKSEGRPENWSKINDVYRRIRHRQELIEPLLPLIDKEGIKANFRFVRVDDLELESKEKAAEYQYNLGKQLIAESKTTGDKLVARQAYAELEKISRYYNNYRDRKQLMDQALDLGTTYVVFHMNNRSNTVIPREMEQELLRFGVQDLNSQWRVFHTNPQPGVAYDYKVEMNLNRLDVGPEVVKEREYVDSKEIEDGFDYVLDERGNVKKDTAGNDIKIPKKVLVKARVLEVFQTKVASVSGRIEWYDLHNNQLMESQPLTADAVFENYASTFQGDKRALSDQSRKRIGNRPLPFPTNEALLLTAATQLQPVIKEKIAYTGKII